VGDPRRPQLGSIRIAEMAFLNNASAGTDVRVNRSSRSRTTWGIRLSNNALIASGRPLRCGRQANHIERISHGANALKAEACCYQGGARQVWAEGIELFDDTPLEGTAIVVSLDADAHYCDADNPC
jgi:hypothetical protein